MDRDARRSIRTAFVAAACMIASLLLQSSAALVDVATPRVIRQEDFQGGLKPLEPTNRGEPAKLPERDIQKYDDKEVLITSLLGMRFVATPEEIIKTGAKDAGIEIKNLPALDNDGFRAIVNAYLGKPVTMRTIGMIIRDTIMYYRSKDRPVVDVFTPEQEITTGVIQFMVVEARVGKVKTAGLKWFSDDYVTSRVRLKSGDVIYSTPLLSDIDYVNRNPFLFVRPVLEPGKDFGTTDVTLDGRDRFPMRFYVGYDDTGSRDTGLERFFAGFNAGNLFSLGHEAGYQYTTNRHFSDFGIHSAYYRIPLPNRDTLAFFGNYADYYTSPGTTWLHSENWMAHTRYITQLPSVGTLRHSLEFGFDFRRASNDFQLGGVSVYDDYVDVAQWAFQYGGRALDKYGDTSFVANVYWSPCENLLTHHQDDEHYNSVRLNSRAEYVYAHASVERLWVLPQSWSFFNRVTGQMSNRRLPPTEQLGMGGWETVRGFDERDWNADQGLMATAEIRTPQFPIKFDDPKHILSYYQFLVFCDYGYGANRGHDSTEEKYENMSSVGPGLRVRLSDNMHIRVDYGFKLDDVPDSRSDDGRFHIFFMLAY